LISQLKVNASEFLRELTWKAKLKIADIAMPVAAAAAGGAPAGGAAAAKDEPAEDAAPAAAEKAVLTVKLESFEAAAKAKIIREVKALLGCNLVEAKTMVEKAPTVLKENVVRDVLPRRLPAHANSQGCKESQRGHRKARRKGHSVIIQIFIFTILENRLLCPSKIPFADSP
jgi:ribosomal protein L7/L12